MADLNNDVQEPVKFKAVPAKEQNIGVETKKSIVNKLKDDEGLSSQINSSILSGFRDVSSSRELQYQMYDEMAKDVIISSALDLYADDATEYDESGRIIWAVSDDAEISKAANYLIKVLKLNENAWLHIRSLVQYGDIFLQTYRASDVDEDANQNRDKLTKNANYNRKLTESKKSSKEKDPYLLEDVIVNYYSENDKLEDYIEMVPNPAEIFDLVKRGKTNGFLKTSIPEDSKKKSTIGITNSLSNYNFGIKSNDIKIYDATKYVHIYLPDPANRSPETVQLFRDSSSAKTNNREKYIDGLTFNVRRGKSILYDIYKSYRELKLLEDSLLLSRLTKSSILRIVQIEVGDMGKAAVQQVLQRVKSLMEQKTAMTENEDYGSYLNPGAIENNIYVPIRDGKGQITTSTVGGDYEPGQLTDIDYYNNKLFGGLKIPKPFLGFMDDNAGFSGGESLIKASSRYAKTIKRIKNAYIQGITTLCNIFFIDRGALSYVNNFDIMMVSPNTTEDAERMEIVQNKTQLIADIMSVLGDIDSTSDRLKVAKLLINKYIPDEDLDELLDEIIAKQENENDESGSDDKKQSIIDNAKNDLGLSSNIGGDNLNNEFNNNIEDNTSDETPPEEDEERLPNPSELDMDLADNDEVSNQLGGEE